MEDKAAAANRRFVRWEEEVVSTYKGKREVHFVAFDEDGFPEVAVVGKERSARHMSYALQRRFLRYLLAVADASRFDDGLISPEMMAEGFVLKWKARRDVLEWLSSVISDSTCGGRSSPEDAVYDNEDADPSTVSSSKVLLPADRRNNLEGFSWSGSSWKCRKRRKHYQSFCQKGSTIWVHNFVLILDNEDKQHVAYVEDLYEDSRQQKMAVVRLFRKTEEINIVLPPDVKDMEVFFSPCLQDFCVERIVGLATVLCPQHFEMCRKDDVSQAFLCHRQIDNDDIKPFDVTHMQGYGTQAVVCRLSQPNLKLRIKLPCSGSSNSGSGASAAAAGDSNSLAGQKRKLNLSSVRPAAINTSRVAFPSLVQPKSGFPEQFHPGCHVELLSQDSGIRGCWFRCVVVKKRCDKVKIRYLDVQNAEGNDKLEEWVLSSRVAVPDELGIRLTGRPVVRPQQFHDAQIVSSFYAGAIVDAWWHDAWWEGIALHHETNGRVHVYFPWEKRHSTFDAKDLRCSKEWMSNKWHRIEDQEQIVKALLCHAECANCAVSADRKEEGEGVETANEPNVTVASVTEVSEVLSLNYGCNPCMMDLAKDLRRNGLRWSARKRRKFNTGQSRRHSDTSSGSSRGGEEELSLCGAFAKSMAPLFPLPAISSLVMSQ